ncbi:RICIN domain-containing protein, partial [Streptomyces sp. NPDC003470]
SYRQLERNATDAGDVLPRATISAALGRDDLPREELLAAYVRACGGDDETVAAWLEARRRLSMTDPMAPPPVPEGAPATAAAQDEEDTPQETPRDLEVHVHEDQHDSDTGPAAAPLRAGDGDAAPDRRSAWRRHSPQAAIAACVVAGVLALTFWPHDNHSDGNRADRAPTGVPSSGTTPSAPAGVQPSGTAPGAGGETKDAGPSPTTELVPPPVDPPAEREEATPSTRPTHARTAAARMPASGAARIHPASASSRCLTEGRERNGRTDREIAVQHPCADSPLPRVELEKLEDAIYRIRWYHPGPGKGLGCLAVDDSLTSSGALLAPWDCADGDNQKFRLEASGDGFRLRPLHSGLCIGFLPPVTDGAEAVQTACTGASDQVFTFTSA